MLNPISMFVNGEWVISSSSSMLEIVNPYNGEHLVTLVEPTKQEISNLILNSFETFNRDKLEPERRFQILSNAAALLRERKNEIAQVISKECGKPIRDAVSEVLRAVTTFQCSAEESKRLYGYTEALSPAVGSDHSLGLTIREPVGVVCAITPFNFPLNLAAHKVAPALAAGNTVVFKPAEQTTLTGKLLVEILQDAGLPPGHLNMAVGRGENVGEVLLQDERIQFYSFTGSAKVGHHIKSKAGFRRVALELGSNAPNIVHSDADIEAAAKLLVKASFSFAGQVCISAQRIYVHRDIADEFTRRFIQLTKELNIGNPLSESTDIGPVINERQAERILSWIDEAKASGAVVLCGGQGRGSMVEPTIIMGSKSNDKVMCEEIFGPVVNLILYDHLDRLIESVNDSKYGLQAGIFTNDLHIAMHLARSINVGGININNASISRADTMPYGGIGHSGVGKEGPKFAMEEMTNVKVITLNTRTHSLS